MTASIDTARTKLVHGLDEAEVQALLQNAERREVGADAVLLLIGETNASLFLILSGAAKVERLHVEENMELAELGPGDTFGEMSLLDGSKATASVTTTKPTEFLELTGEAIGRLIESQPALAAKLWRNVAVDLKHRLEATNELVDHYMDLNQVLLERPEVGAVMRG